MSGLMIKRLHKRYGEHVAIEEVSLAIEQGKFCILLGPSGCGKSTTLNCIAGLEELTSGRITLGGRDITALAPHQRDIAMVFQSALLYPHLSARENIRMSLRNLRAEPAEIERRVNHAAQMLEIGPLLAKKPSAMSGGQRQRVAIAKAIVREPAAFLLDEPLSALDAALRQSLRSELVHLQKQLGVTTVFVTHDQVEAMTMGDVIVVMNEGRIEQVGTPQEIYEAPVSRFVAGFVGSPQMNFFPGHVHRHDGAAFLRYVETDIALPLPLAALVPAGGRADLAVRPQHVVIETAYSAGTIPVSVYAVERLGKENVIILRHDSGDMFRVLTAPTLQYTIGDRAYMKLDAKQGYIFPMAG